MIQNFTYHNSVNYDDTDLADFYFPPFEAFLTDPSAPELKSNQQKHPLPLIDSGTSDGIKDSDEMEVDSEDLVQDATASSSNLTQQFELSTEASSPPR